MIRTARPEEVDELVDIVRRSFADVSIDKAIEETFGRVIGMAWHERKALDIKRDVKLNPEGIFVRLEKGIIAGFITTAVDRDSGTGRIPHLAVLPEYQGKGIGKALLNHALRFLKTSGAKMMRIEATATNKKALELYVKTGFKEVSRQVYLAMPSEKFPD
jgi:ribosomal protein S18 acetylase RimI-like enzyme